MGNRILLAAASVAALSTSSADTSKPPCCFKNPAYSGICRVEPAEEETCADILAYLNNPMAHGKSYCGGTEVRQGWTEVSCEEKEIRSESAIQNRNQFSPN
jgi:hypothetical protein